MTTEQITETPAMVLEALSSGVDAESLFVVCYAHLAFSRGNTPQEDSAPAKLEHLAFHLLRNRQEANSESLTPWHVKQALYLLDDLFSHNIRDAIPGDHAPQEDFDSISRLLFLQTSIVRGAAYPWQTESKIAGIHERYSMWFQKQVGIGPARAVEILYAIAKSQETRINQLWQDDIVPFGQAMAQQWTKLHHRRPRKGRSDPLYDSDIVQHLTSQTEALIFGQLLKMIELLPKKLPVSREDLPLSHLPSVDEWNGLVNLIGATQSRINAMNAPIEMKNFPLFCLDDNRVLLGELSNSFDQLWRVFDELMIKQQQCSQKTSDSYRKHKSKWLEEQVASHLRKVFPPEQVFVGLSYPDPDKPPGSSAEADIIVHWPPFLLLCEAKAKQFRLEGHIGNTKLLKRDLIANVEDAFEQARRTARYVNSVEKANFREISTGRTLSVDRSSVQRLYIVTASLHQLANLASRLTITVPLGLFRDGEYPWALSVADLEIVSRFVPGPDAFLHYVERRIAIQKENLHLIADELELFGAYMQTRLQADRLWKKNSTDQPAVDCMWLAGYQTQFDLAVEHGNGADKSASNVRLEVPSEVAEILDELRTRGNDTSARWIAHCLLSMPDEALAVVAKTFRELRGQKITPGMYRRISQSVGNAVITLVATIDQSLEDLRERTVHRATLEKYRRKAEQSIGFGIHLADPKSLFDCAVWLDTPWVHDPNLDALVTNDPVPTYLLNKNRLPGRNKPCLCGSGIKFKRCCLPKIA